MDVVAADPEIATKIFQADLDRAANSVFASRWGWAIEKTDALTAVVRLHAVRSDGGEDQYHLQLRGDWYNAWPPDAIFVAPPLEGSTVWRVPGTGSKWVPSIDASKTNPPSSIMVHTAYGQPAVPGQLICCSYSLGYYLTDHKPTTGQRWTPGKHTLIALINRVQNALASGAYLGRAGDLDT